MMQKSNNRRAAFTLTEILVVIAIICILAALTAAGVFVTIGMQTRRNTNSTILTLDKLLKSRWDAVVREASKETPSAPVLALAQGNQERARVIWIKVRLVEAFPTKYSEVIGLASPPAQASIVNTYIVPPTTRKAHFTKYQSLLKNATPGSPGESAACLLMALKTLGNDGVSIDDQLKFAISANDNPRPTPVNSIVNKIDTLVDGWGYPLVFNRFDVSPLVQAANPVKNNNDRKFKYADPDDPDGTLMNLSWYLATSVPPQPTVKQQFEGYTVPGPGISGFYTIALAPPPANPPRANYVQPTITSAGKDNILGNGDDIINIQLRGQ